MQEAISHPHPLQRKICRASGCWTQDRVLWGLRRVEGLVSLLSKAKSTTACPDSVAPTESGTMDAPEPPFHLSQAHACARTNTHTHTISQTQIPAPWKLISFPALIRFLFPRSTLLLPTESAPAGSTRYLFHHLVCRAPHKAQAHSKLFTTTCRVSKQNYTHGTQHARSQSHSPLTHTPRPCDLPSPLLLRPNV